MLSVKDGVDLLERLLKWRRSKHNPVRRQAVRELAAETLTDQLAIHVPHT